MLLSAYRAFVALVTFCFVAFLFQGILTGDVDTYFALVEHRYFGDDHGRRCLFKYRPWMRHDFNP